MERPVPPVTVVVVHWNQPVRLRATLAALGDQGVPVEVIVVDNGSEPEALGLLREAVAEAPLPAVLIECGRNTGFGPAANTGLRLWLEEGTGSWAAVVPHDALPEPGALARLVAMAEAEHHVGLACADVGDGHVPVHDPYFGGMTVPAAPIEPGGQRWDVVDYPHGTLMLLRRDCLEQVGLFDERYFAYCEEADLGARARSAGWAVGLARGVRVTNPTMRSGSPVVDYLMHRNTLLLVREHSGLYHAGIRLLIALFQLVRGVVQPSSRAWLFDARGRVAGIVDFCRGRFGPPPERLLRGAGGPELDPSAVAAAERDPSVAAAVGAGAGHQTAEALPGDPHADEGAGRSVEVQTVVP